MPGPDAGPDAGPDQTPDLLPPELAGGGGGGGGSGNEDFTLPEPLPAPPLCVVFVELANINGYEQGTLKLTLPHVLGNGAFVVDHTQTKRVERTDVSGGEMSGTTGRIVFDPVPQGVSANVSVPTARINAAITIPAASVYQIVEAQ